MTFKSVLHESLALFRFLLWFDTHWAIPSEMKVHDLATSRLDDSDKRKGQTG